MNTALPSGYEIEVLRQQLHTVQLDLQRLKFERHLQSMTVDFALMLGASCLLFYIAFKFF